MKRVVVGVVAVVALGGAGFAFRYFFRSTFSITVVARVDGCSVRGSAESRFTRAQLGGVRFACGASVPVANERVVASCACAAELAAAGEDAIFQASVGGCRFVEDGVSREVACGAQVETKQGDFMRCGCGE